MVVASQNVKRLNMNMGSCGCGVLRKRHKAFPRKLLNVTFEPQSNKKACPKTDHFGPKLIA